MHNEITRRIQTVYLLDEEMSNDNWLNARDEYFSR
jgi:hypothetical protein